jgi:hypothetical protein
MNMMETDMPIKDELDAYREGFRDGKQFVLEMIKESTKQEFEDIADLIIWIRQQESKNETE